MNPINKISETAFLVNASRARKVEISQDRYARLWVSDATRELWDDFASNVYAQDDQVVSVRTRYFLDHLNAFITSFESPVFINVGAGFTSYPFLIRQPCRCIEIDYEHIIHYKRNKITDWQREGLLPPHQVEYFAADLNHPVQRERFKSQLAQWIDNHPSFILLEGITYFLAKPVLRELLEAFSVVQCTDSLVGFDFWKPDIQTYPVFIRLQKYVAEKFGYKETQYNLFDEDFINSLLAYQVEEITTVIEQEIIYTQPPILQDREKVLPENYVILKKTEKSL
ncbi:MAG TPA: class I SAM-dependent methyltransferase [Candidatus Limnocylindrales bacterium]|nr:class I SAM-dependent methyltransferase [Candidatus Limnocylindrales bacterium]